MNPKNHKLDKAKRAFLKHETFHGNEIVANTRHLCLRNMFLHNIGEIDGGSLIAPNDALIAPSPEPWTKQVWHYDYRTNIHHTLKRNPLRFEDLQDFITCYNPLNPENRQATWHPEENPEGRWRSYSLEELMGRDKASLDVFWLKDKSLTDLDNLPEPDELAEEIIENLEAGLNSFRQVLNGLTAQS